MVKLSRSAMNGEWFTAVGVVWGYELILWVMGRFRAPEALFQPSFLGLEAAGIHETT